MKKTLFFAFTIFFTFFLFSQNSRFYISKLDDIGLVCKTNFKKLKINGQVKADNFVEVVYIRKGTLAYNVGLRKGDVILSVNKQPVLSEFQVLDLINFTPRNVDVVLNILRNGKRIDVVLFKKVDVIDGKKKRLKLGTGSSSDINSNATKIEKPESKPIIFYTAHPEKSRKKIIKKEVVKTSEKGSINFYFGFDFVEVNSQLAKTFGVDEGSIFILKVDKNSPAQSAGLKAGDILLTVDGFKIKGVLSLTKYIFKNVSSKKGFTFVIKRGKKLLSLKVFPLLRTEKYPFHM